MNTETIKLNDISRGDIADIRKIPLKRRSVKISSRELKNIGKYFIEYAPFGILTLNKEGYIDFCSDKVVDFTGANKPSDLIGIHAPSLPTYKQIGLSKYIKKAYQGNLFESHPVKYYSYFGAIKSIRKFTIIPLKDYWGKINRLLLIIEDAKEQEEAKDELKQKERELKILVELRTKELQNKISELEDSKEATLNVLSELNIAYSKLKELDKIKSNFIDVVSHQLRTPLTSIKWNLEMILSGSMGKIRSQKQKQSFEYIFSGILTLVENLEDMIAVSSIDISDKIQIIEQRVSLNELLSEVIDETKKLALLNKINIDIENNISKDIFRFDRLKMKKVFKVLVDNAIKYSRIGKRVLIKIDQENKYNKQLIISVEDAGIGIMKNQQERLFEKFFRSKNATYHAPNGLGLGLYIAKKYVEAHDGTLSFKSIEGKGTTFFVNIPYK